jgi:hypothetical protein
MDRHPVPAGSASHRPAAPPTPPGAPRLAVLRPWVPWTATVVRLGLAVVWEWAARAKILDPAGAVLIDCGCFSTGGARRGSCGPAWPC